MNPFLWLIDTIITLYIWILIASAILFVLIARGYGSRRLLRDTLIALVLSTAVFLLFTKALGLNLPAGLIVF